jgi:ribosome-associated protein
MLPSRACFFRRDWATVAAMHDEDDIELPKSKSQLKREMNALQDLGTALIKLGAKDLAKVPLPDNLAEAIHHARSIKSHGALRRQMQYIGKLMRDVDAEPIRQALDSIRQTGQRSTAHFHAVEQWRDRLIKEGQGALDAFIAEHPEADRQQLRQLMLNAEREHKQNKPPKSSRTLFRLIRELLDTEQ